MRDIREFKGTHRVKRVALDINGEPTEVVLHVPVGHLAVEFLRAVRKLIALLAGLVELQRSLGLPVGGGADADYEGAVEKLIETEDGKAELELVGEKSTELDEASLAFAFEWLPVLSPELAEMGEEGVGNVIRLTGFARSPLIVALQSMARISQGAEKGDDGLDDLPFPDLHAD